MALPRLRRHGEGMCDFHSCLQMSGVAFGSTAWSHSGLRLQNVWAETFKHKGGERECHQWLPCSPGSKRIDVWSWFYRRETGSPLLVVGECMRRHYLSLKSILTAKAQHWGWGWEEIMNRSAAARSLTVHLCSMCSRGIKCNRDSTDWHVCLRQTTGSR